jgi:hypothetical protein
MEEAHDDHDISEIFNWYDRFAGANPPARDVREDFLSIQELAAELDLLTDRFSTPGSISVVLPSNEEPNLSILHQAITVSHYSTYALRYLFRHSVRRFYCNFSHHDVTTISKRMTAKVTLMELLVVLNRVLSSQTEEGVYKKYPNIHEDDLPYRSKSWVQRLIEYVESDFIGSRFVENEDLAHINVLVGHMLEAIDYYEIALAGNEARFLWQFVFGRNE